jgi:transcriptional regulator with XRE-family HTH domain
VDIKALGRRLTEYRDKAGLTMESLASRSGVAENTILAIEKGRGNPTVQTLDALAKCLKIEVPELFGSANRAAKSSQSGSGLADAIKILEALSKRGPATRSAVLFLLTRDESYIDELRALGAGPIALALTKIPKVI